MNYFFEIYYCNANTVVYCGDVDTEKEALDEVNNLGKEFPENKYWYEAVSSVRIDE